MLKDCTKCGNSWLRCSGDCSYWHWYTDYGIGDRDSPNDCYHPGGIGELVGKEIVATRHELFDYADHVDLWLRKEGEDWTKYEVRSVMEPQFYCEEADEQ